MEIRIVGKMAYSSKQRVRSHCTGKRQGGKGIRDTRDRKKQIEPASQPASKMLYRSNTNTECTAAVADFDDHCHNNKYLVKARGHQAM